MRQRLCNKPERTHRPLACIEHTAERTIRATAFCSSSSIRPFNVRFCFNFFLISSFCIRYTLLVLTPRKCPIRRVCCGSIWLPNSIISLDKPRASRSTFDSKPYDRIEEDASRPARTGASLSFGDFFSSDAIIPRDAFPLEISTFQG